MENRLTIKSLIYFVFAPVWESSQQQRYIPGGRDFREAKLLLEHSNLTRADIAELKRRAENFLRSSYWESARWPAWAFFRNIERYAEHVKKARPQLSEAYLCECGEAVALKEQAEHEKRCSIYIALEKRS